MAIGDKIINLILKAEDKTAAAFSGVRSGVGGLFDKLFSLKALVAGLFASLGVAKLAGDFLDTASAFENLETSLITVTGSLEGAKQAMAFANAEAAKSPFTVLEYANAIKTLAAYGLDYEANMRTLGDTAAAMGKPLSQAVEALADAVQGEGERLKEFGIKQKVAGDQITYTWIDTFGKVRNTIAENNPKIIEETLRGIWNEKYAGGMDRFSNTWSGLTSTLKSLWDEFLVAVGKAGALDAAKDAVRKIIDTVNEMKRTGSFDEWSKSVGQGVGRVIDWISDLIIGVGKLDAVLDITAGSFGVFRDTVATIINHVAAFVLEGFGQIAGAIDTITFGTIPGLDTIENELKTLASGARAAAEETGMSWAENTIKVGNAWDVLSAKGKTTKFDDVANALKATAAEAGKVPAPIEEAGKALEKTGEQTAKAKKEAQEFQLELLKLASNERIKTIEMSFNLQTEQLKAQTDRAKAIISSIDNSITSTGDLLGSLFGDLNDAGSLSDKWSIESQIKDENRRREDAFKLQQKLTEQEIKMNDIRIRRLQSGDAEIKIDTSGVEPALEAVLWNIIEKAQVRVNEEAAELLLGI